MEKDAALNVFGEKLEPCSNDPVTGFFRDGCCNTCAEDQGSHTICVELTDEFLEFSKKAGNDLSTPVPQFEFPGLKAGDGWCLCAGRWLEAHDHGMAPKVNLLKTHIKALEIVPLEVIRKYAKDLM